LLYNTGKKGRRTGLGFTALADALAALGLPFDSKDALLFTEEMMRKKCEAEFDSSIDMSIERGKFEIFEADIENQSDFIKMLKAELPHVYNRMMKHGRRNISISTVAPTGSLSILAQTSSGIEPVYMLSYTRRKKINASDQTQRVDFTDAMGDKWQEFTVFHHKVKNWMDVTGNKNIIESPYAGSTAPEIDWEKRVSMQAVVQKYTTHSISSTINLPSDVSMDKVGNIYMQAWQQGLKGITVYRDGSRSGVLVQESSKKETSVITDSQAPERPKKLEAQIVRFMNENESGLLLWAC
jgi:ribonucleoside-diphosphate reductase alpha chain